MNDVTVWHHSSAHFVFTNSLRRNSLDSCLHKWNKIICLLVCGIMHRNNFAFSLHIIETWWHLTQRTPRWVCVARYINADVNKPPRASIHRSCYATVGMRGQFVAVWQMTGETVTCCFVKQRSVTSAPFLNKLMLPEQKSHTAKYNRQLRGRDGGAFPVRITLACWVSRRFFTWRKQDGKLHAKLCQFLTSRTVVQTVPLIDVSVELKRQNINTI